MGDGAFGTCCFHQGDNEMHEAPRAILMRYENEVGDKMAGGVVVEGNIQSPHNSVDG